MISAQTPVNEQQQPIRLRAGDTQMVSIPIYDADGSTPDFSQASAEWLMGVLPLDPSSRSAPGNLETRVLVLKATGANLVIDQVAGVSTLRFTIQQSDTITILPGQYTHQAIVTDVAGNVSTVAAGPFILEGSLRSARFTPSTSDAPPLSLPAFDSFAVWQGDDTPPKTWAFGPSNAPADLTGSVFVLTVTGLSTSGSDLVLRSDTPNSALSVDLPTGSVRWAYTRAQSALIPTSGLGYTLDRLIAGTTQLWTHGRVVGLAP